MGSIYVFHAEEFCSNKAQQQSPPTPFTSFLASKAGLMSFYLQHTATNMLRMFAQRAPLGQTHSL